MNFLRKSKCICNQLHFPGFILFSSLTVFLPPRHPSVLHSLIALSPFKGDLAVPSPLCQSRNPCCWQDKLSLAGQSLFGWQRTTVARGKCIESLELRAGQRITVKIQRIPPKWVDPKNMPFNLTKVCSMLSLRGSIQLVADSWLQDGLQPLMSISSANSCCNSAATESSGRDL